MTDHSYQQWKNDPPPEPPTQPAPPPTQRKFDPTKFNAMATLIAGGVFVLGVIFLLGSAASSDNCSNYGSCSIATSNGLGVLGLLGLALGGVGLVICLIFAIAEIGRRK